MRPSGSPASLERRRHRALTLLQDGWQPVDVAKKVGVDRRSVRRWRAAFEQQGKRGLAAKPACGRPPKLDEVDRRRLEKLLLKGAAVNGFATELWTCSRVSDLIRREFAVTYHPDHNGRLLRSMGWSPQRPARRARERDEVRIQGWIKKQWPRLKRGRQL